MRSPSSGQSLARRRFGIVAGIVVPCLVAGSAYFAWIAHTHPPLTGDEPCYLIVARSLAVDHDLDLTNEFRDPLGVARFSPDIANNRYQNCAANYRNDGKIRSAYSPGLPILLAPVLRVTFAIDHMRWAMILGAVLVAQQLLGLLRDIRGSTSWTVWAAWAAAVLTLPMVAFANQFYPELAGAFVCIVSARCLLRASRRRSWLVAAATAPAVLPWLHFRFALLSLGLVALAAAAIPTEAAWKRRGVLARRAVCLAPLAVSLAVLALVYQHLYGSPLPNAPYRGGHAGGHSYLIRWSITHSYRVGLGTLVDRHSGLLPFNPVLLVGIIGLPAIGWRYGRAGWALIALGAAQLVIVNPLGFFAQSLPGRFAIVLIPLLAVGLLLALERSTSLRLVAVPLALVALAAVVEGYRHYGSLYGAETGHLRLVQDLSHVLPGDRLLAPNGLLLAASWVVLPFAAGVVLWKPARAKGRQPRVGQ